MINEMWVEELITLAPTADISQWLTKPYILSKALKRVCQTLSVKVIAQNFNAAFDDEYPILNMEPHEHPFIRQVFLQGDNIPLTYGRVVIPTKTYHQHVEKFINLASNLLGETLLYGNPNVKRGPFEYGEFNKSSELIKEIYIHLPDMFPCESLWGRRSVFWIKQDPLLVTEVFLPTIPPFCPDNQE
jgi:chorismate lyase